MSYSVINSRTFDRQLSRLAKKYRSIIDDVRTLSKSLENDPTQGTALGNGLYKIRMQITSKGQGKSGGARVITCIKVVDGKVILGAIYDKSDVETMTAKQLIELLK